jgi:hypothetical protein
MVNHGRKYLQHVVQEVALGKSEFLDIICGS